MSETPTWTFTYLDGTFESVTMREGMYVRVFPANLNVYDGKGNYTIYYKCSLRNVHVETVKGKKDAGEKIRRAEGHPSAGSITEAIDANVRYERECWRNRLDEVGLKLSPRGRIVRKTPFGADGSQLSFVTREEADRALKGLNKAWHIMLDAAGLYKTVDGRILSIDMKEYENVGKPTGEGVEGDPEVGGRGDVHIDPAGGVDGSEGDAARV